MAVVDIGANIGYFTLLFSTLVGENGRVYAFEPEPRNYDLLVKNMEFNGFKNVIPLQKAVSNETGKVELFVDLLESGGHSIHQAAVQWGNESLTKPIPVDAASLDDVFKNEKRPIDIIKMDIQGAEPMALLGMKKTAENSKDMKMITEFWPYGLQKSGSSAKECWDLLLRLGFKFIYRINDRNEKLEPADLQGIIRHCAGSMLRPPTSVNLLCTKTPLEKSTS